jgi:hypothetical protein
VSIDAAARKVFAIPWFPRGSGQSSRTRAFKEILPMKHKPLPLPLILLAGVVASGCVGICTARLLTMMSPAFAIPPVEVQQ